MSFWRNWIRSIIYLTTALLTVAVYVVLRRGIGWYYLRLIRLTEWYGLLSVLYLYLALLISPLYMAFPVLPGKPLAVHARRALGVGAFFFGLLHSLLAFFDLLQGFRGLGFLGAHYLVANGLGLLGLVIMALLALTSFDIAVHMMGRWWKRLHRWVYLAGFAVLLHMLLLGAHFVTLNHTLPVIFFVALGILLVLESLRLDKVIKRRYPIAGRYSFAPMILLLIFFYVMVLQNHLKHYFGLHVH